MRTAYSILILSLVAIMLSFLLCAVSGYFYPMRYIEEIQSVSEEFDVSASLIAAVINVESGYNPSAKSNKGAVGLMQLMPSTAEWLCGNLRLEYEESKLTEPEYNIRLGGYYLSYLIKNFDSTENAILAYNAGYGNVKGWLKDVALCPDGKKITTIPFEETRNYIAKINKNMHHYNKKYK